MAQLFRKYLLLALLVAVSEVVRASGNEPAEPTPAEPKVDTLIAVDRVQITAIKQGSELRREAVAASVLNFRSRADLSQCSAFPLTETENSV